MTFVLSRSEFSLCRFKMRTYSERIHLSRIADNRGNLVASPELPLGQSEIDLSLDTNRDDLRADTKQGVCQLTLYDYLFIAVPLLFVVPLFHLARLPLRIDIKSMAVAYWGGTLVGAAFFATIYAVIMFPLELILNPFLMRVQKQKTRIVIALVLLSIMILLMGWMLGVMVTIAVLGISEMYERRAERFKLALADVFFPALYLFCGLVVVSLFNHALAGIRYAATNDELFSRLDQLVFHANVAHIAHWSMSHLPLGFFRFLEFFYYGMFAQVTAILIFIVLRGNQHYGIKYVRTLLTCYAIAVTVFAICPVKGPYSIGTLHLMTYPRALPTFWAEEVFLDRVRALYAHNLAPDMIAVSFKDYYVGFPSLHTALPIVGLWFLRPWKRLAAFRFFWYTLLLLPSIILLEWHFLMDIAGGFVTAFLSIWLVERFSRSNVEEDALRANPTHRFSQSAPFPEDLIRELTTRN